MAHNEDGEFELVLGNRQLLSGFFIVVILFGIFFTMGYFVGRSSSPSSVAPTHSSLGTAAAASGAPLSPGQVEVVSGEARPPSGGQAPPATRAALDSGAPHPAEEPAVEPPAPRGPSVSPKSDPEASNSEKAGKKQARAAEAKEAAAKDASRAGEKGDLVLARPRKGDTYLQVSAPLPPAAKGVVGALQRQGIEAIVAPGPAGKDTVRVLVGPFPDSASAGKMRARLAEIGFKDSFLQKY